MSRPNTKAGNQTPSTLIFRSQLGTARTWYPRCINYAGKPLMTIGPLWNTPRPRPNVATTPTLRCT